MQSIDQVQLRSIAGGTDVIPQDNELRIIEIIKKLLE